MISNNRTPALNESSAALALDYESVVESDPSDSDCPEVSVLVLCYGRLDFLSECLRSVTSQTGLSLTEWEVVLVSNMPQAGTVLEKSVSSLGVRHRFVLSDAKPVGQFMLDGVRACRSELISILDEDDMWRPGKLAKVLREFRSHNRAGLVRDQIQVVDRNGRESKSLDRVSRFRMGRRVSIGEFSPEAPRLSRIYPGHPFHNESTMTVRKAILIRNGLGLRRVTAGQDAFIFFATLAEHRSVILLKEAFTLYRSHDSNASRAKAKSMRAKLERLSGNSNLLFDMVAILDALLEPAAEPPVQELWGFVRSAIRFIATLQSPVPTRRCLFTAWTQLPQKMLFAAPLEVARLATVGVIFLLSPRVAQRLYVAGR